MKSKNLFHIVGVFTAIFQLEKKILHCLILYNIIYIYIVPFFSNHKHRFNNELKHTPHYAFTLLKRNRRMSTR